MKTLSRLFLATFFSFGFTATASAQMVIQGSGAARDCYMKVKTGDPGKASTIRFCEDALTEMTLPHRDEAATHVNIGVLYMRKGDYSLAQASYSRAIEMRPKLSEAYINHGASLIYTGDYSEALAALNTAIDLNTKKMPEALFNRAMAYDRMENYKSAYKDLKQALVLKPEWPAALKALDNYVVTSSARTN